MTMDIDKLSKDLKQICLRWDQILDKMNGMKIDVEELKRFTRYDSEKQQKHCCKCKIEEKQQKHCCKCKIEEKRKTSKPEKKRKPFPPELGEKLIRDATVDDLYDFSDIQELQTLYAPAIKCCHTKQPGQSGPSGVTATSLELLLLKDVVELLGEVSQQELGTVT